MNILERSPDISFGPKSITSKRTSSEAGFNGPSPKKITRGRREFGIESLDLSNTPADPFHLSNITPTFTKVDLRFYTPTKTPFLLHQPSGPDQTSEEYDFDDEEEEEEEAEVQNGGTVSPFPPDNFLESALMDPFGPLVPDPFFYSNEPRSEESNLSDVLNTPPHRSPSPILTPVMSPATPETPPLSTSPTPGSTKTTTQTPSPKSSQPSNPNKRINKSKPLDVSLPPPRSKSIVPTVNSELSLPFNEVVSDYVSANLTTDIP